MKELISNPTVLLAIVFLIALVYVALLQPSRLKEWLLNAVFDAEKLYGSKTGQIKLKYVYSLFIKRFPFMSNIISYSLFKKMVDTALQKLEELVKDNKSIKDILDFYTVKKVEPAKKTIENKEK